MLPWCFIITGIALHAVCGAIQSPLSLSLSPMKLANTTIDYISTEYGENTSIPLLELYNFQSDGAISILNQLMNLDTNVFDETKIQFVQHSDLNYNLLALRYADDDTRVSEPDATILYIHKNMLFDDNIVLQQVRIALEAILTPSMTESDCAERKKSMIIVYNGPIQSRDSTIQLVNEAIGSMDLFLLRKIEKINVDVSLITVKDGKVTQEDRATFNNKLAPLFDSAMKVKDFSLAQPKTVASLSRVDSLGLSAALQSSSEALEWARLAVNASIPKIHKNELDFPIFMRNLVEDSIEVFNELLAGKTVSWESCKLGRDELTISIYEMMAPFYQHFVATIRQDVTNKFNREVTEEMEVTVHLMRDMRASRDRFVSEFSTRIAKLCPTRKMSTSWNGHFEVCLFRMQLNEYIAVRETEAKIEGVLFRGRTCLTVTMLWLVNHPLWRDRKQGGTGGSGYTRRVGLVFTPSSSTAMQQVPVFPLRITNPMVRVEEGRRYKTAKRFCEPERSDRKPVSSSEAKASMSMLDGFLNGFPQFGDGLCNESVV